MHFVVIGLKPEISVSLSGTSEFPSLGAIDPMLLPPGSGEGCITSRCLWLAGARSHSARMLQPGIGAQGICTGLQEVQEQGFNDQSARGEGNDRCVCHRRVLRLLLGRLGWVDRQEKKDTSPLGLRLLLCDRQLLQ